MIVIWNSRKNKNVNKIRDESENFLFDQIEIETIFFVIRNSVKQFGMLIGENECKLMRFISLLLKFWGLCASERVREKVKKKKSKFLEEKKELKKNDWKTKSHLI